MHYLAAAGEPLPSLSWCSLPLILTRRKENKAPDGCGAMRCVAQWCAAHHPRLVRAPNHPYPLRLVRVLVVGQAGVGAAYLCSNVNRITLS